MELWRIKLNEEEQKIVREQRNEKRKNARDPDVVLAEIAARLDAEAKSFGLLPDEYRSRLKAGTLPNKKVSKPIKLQGRAGSTLREWSIIHQITTDE